MASKNRRHALVVGGTGMLRGAVLGLAERGSVVTVLARRSSPLAVLEASARDRIFGVSVDYRNSGRLDHVVREAVQRRGPIALCIAWIHDDALDAVAVLVRALRMQRETAHFYEVRSSHAADPLHAAPAVVTSFDSVHGHEVILGFVRKGNGQSRWLTNHEISAGIIDAVDDGLSRSIVGAVRPWEDRP